MNGQVAGTWRQTKKRDRIVIYVEPFRELTDREYRRLEGAADRYGRFYNTTAELRR